MNPKRIVLVRAGLGLISLVAAAVVLVILQICFVQSFWLHSIVFPLNPQTLAQPTTLSYVGATCELLFPFLLLLGLGLLLSAAWRAFRYARKNA